MYNEASIFLYKQDLYFIPTFQLNGTDVTCLAFSFHIIRDLIQDKSYSGFLIAEDGQDVSLHVIFLIFEIILHRFESLLF